MNFGTIKTELANTFDSNSATRLGVWTNAAYHEILGKRTWSCRIATSTAFSLVASQQNYVLAGSGTPLITDYGGIVDVYITMTSGGIMVPLTPTDPQVFDRLSGHSRVNGTPSVYTVTGGAPDTSAANVRAGGKQDLLLWPTPTAVSGEGTHCGIRYYRSVASCEMSSDSDIPILPTQDHYAIVLLARLYGYEANGLLGSEDAARTRESFESRLATMIEEDDAKQPIRVRGRLEMVEPQPPNPQNPSVSNPRTRPLST